MDVKIFSKSLELQAYQISLSRGEFLPIHDHPEQTVFFYVLSGKIKSLCYSKISNGGENSIIREESDTILNTGDTQTIKPEGINLHYLKALEDTIFLDVTTPGYFVTGHCPNWYEIIGKGSNRGEIKVKQIPEPEKLVQLKEEALAEYEINN